MLDNKTNELNEYFSKLCTEYKKHNRITAADFERYNVKRGLRNADGTGVLAGVTQICNVHGYLLNEGERMPIDGEADLPRIFYKRPRSALSERKPLRL